MSNPAPSQAPSRFLLACSSAFIALSLLAACSTRPSAGLPVPDREWRLIPESTVLGDRRQFFVHGEGLDRATVKAGPTVRVEQTWNKPDGKVLSVYLTVVEPIRADTSLGGDKPGLRRISVAAGDTTVTLLLKVADERPR
jgi:hypothetical protein